MIAAIIGLYLSTLPIQAQGTEQQQLDAIWAAANSRMEQQIDVWFDDGQFPMCVQLLRMEYELFPHDYEIATNLGWMFENIEQWNDAVSVYERYLRENRSNPDAALPLAQYWFLKRQYVKVPPVLEGFIKPNSHPNNYRILAHSYERLGRLKDSVAMWEKYIALAPEDKAAKINMARVQKKIDGK